MAGVFENDKFRKLTRDQVEGRILGEHEMVAAGDGCLLIKRRVIREIHPSYLPLRFRLDVRYGSDILFWRQVQEIGFKARLHGGVLCGHLPQHPLSTEVLNKPLITV